MSEPINSSQIYTYNEDKQLIITDNTENKLLVADSFRVTDGKVRALTLHKKRFIESCKIRYQINEKKSENFFNTALTIIDTKSNWFPRLQLIENKSKKLCFQLCIRQCPTISEKTTLSKTALSDFRKDPRHKGRDISQSMHIRHELLSKAKEAVVCTKEHYILESLSSNIFWWENDNLYTPSLRHRILPGITRELIFKIAKDKQISVFEKNIRFENLFAHEIWLSNSLHGIQLVDNAMLTEQSLLRATQWESQLDKFLEPI